MNFAVSEGDLCDAPIQHDDLRYHGVNEIFERRLAGLANQGREIDIAALDCILEQEAGCLADEILVCQRACEDGSLLFPGKLALKLTNHFLQPALFLQKIRLLHLLLSIKKKVREAR